jgi:hypothetical protein
LLFNDGTQPKKRGRQQVTWIIMKTADNNKYTRRKNGFYSVTKIRFIRALFLIVFMYLPCFAKAQKPFDEGKIVYVIKIAGLGNIDNNSNGTCTFTLKGFHLRKDMSYMGYTESILIDAITNSVYTL